MERLLDGVDNLVGQHDWVDGLMLAIRFRLNARDHAEVGRLPAIAGTQERQGAVAPVVPDIDCELRLVDPRLLDTVWDSIDRLQQVEGIQHDEAVPACTTASGIIGPRLSIPYALRQHLMMS